MKTVTQDRQGVIVPEELFRVSVEAIAPSDLGITVYVLRVTPENAAIWLAHVKGNRSIITHNLLMIKHALVNELWELNGEPLVFDENGDLIDGQHRCLACVQTGISFWTLAVHGIDRALFATMGQGSKRTVGDILSSMGKLNTNTLGAACRWVWRYEHGQMMNHSPIIAAYEVAALEPTYATLHFSIPYGNKFRGIVGPALMTALHYLCRKKDESLSEYFYDRLADGAMLHPLSPVMYLRKFLAPRASRGNKRLTFRDEERAPIIIKTWNLLRGKDGIETQIKSNRALMWRSSQGEKYPVIV